MVPEKKRRCRDEEKGAWLEGETGRGRGEKGKRGEEEATGRDERGRGG
jgi:hypothetical protein